MRRLIVVTLLVAAVTAAAATTPTRADHGSLPWIGGLAEVSAFERKLGTFASQLAKRQVSVICNGATDWATLAAQGRFDGRYVWGYVTFQWFHEPDRSVFGPVDYAQFSEQACWYLDEFWAASDKRAITTACRVGTRTEYRTELEYRTKLVWAMKRVRVKGKWLKKRVRVQREVAVGVTVPVEVPVVAPCPGYRAVLHALQTLSHESMHLGGVRNEGIAECHGLQLLDDAARWLGADATLSRQLARDYWTEIYLKRGPRSSYFRFDCVDGRDLDLSPSSRVWPAG